MYTFARLTAAMTTGSVRCESTENESKTETSYQQHHDHSRLKSLELVGTNNAMLEQTTNIICGTRRKENRNTQLKSILHTSFIDLET